VALVLHKQRDLNVAGLIPLDRVIPILTRHQTLPLSHVDAKLPIEKSNF